MKTVSNRFLRRSASVVGVFGIVCFVAATAFAQEKDPKRGFQPGNSYAISDIESINTTNGNLMLRVPLGQLPPGRGSLSGGISLRYNSKLYDSTVDNNIPNRGGNISSQNVLKRNDDAGWAYGYLYTLEFLNRNNLEGGPFDCQFQQAVDDVKAFDIWKVRMIFPDGGAHEFSPVGYSDPGDGYYAVNPNTGEIRNCTSTVGYAPNPLTYYSTDGTYTRLTITRADSTGAGAGWTLSFPDGSRVVNDSGGSRGLFSSSGDKLYDRNNNYIAFGHVTVPEITFGNITLPSTDAAGGMVDQFGRYVAIEHNSSYTEDYIITAGFQKKPLVWTVKWKYIYVTRPYITTPAGHPDGQVPADQTYQSYIQVVDSVTLPSELGSLSYQFSYKAPDYKPGDPIPTVPSHGWGQVSGIKLPSGAQVSYDYGGDIIAEDFTVVQDTRGVLDNTIGLKTVAYQREYDITSTPSSSPTPTPTPIVDKWSYGIGITSSGITAPDGGTTTYYFNDTTQAISYAGLVYKEVHPDGEVIERLWQANAPHRTRFFTTDYGANYFVKTEFRSVSDSSGNPVKTAIKDFTYDKNGNVTTVAEYDWVDYTTVPRTSGRPTGIPAGARLIRTTKNTYAWPTVDASDSSSDEAYSYWKSSSKNLRNAVISTEVTEGSGTAAPKRARTEFVYDDSTTTGNLTKKTSWDSAKGEYSNPLTTGMTGNSISVSTAYDQYGNPTLITDARSNKTQLYYGPVGDFSDLYPTQIKTAYVSSVQRTETRDYDFSTGLVKLVTDMDNNVSTSTDYDVIGRPVLVKAAQGKTEESDTVTVYSDVKRRVIVRSDLSTAGDGKLVTIQHYDQLGRIRLTRQLEDSTTQSETDETVGIKVQTRYLFSGLNSYQLVSNPYRATTSGGASGDLSMGWTRTQLDNGGRVIELQNYSGAALPAPWSANGSGSPTPPPSTGTVTTEYNAEVVTITDQAGKVHRSATDGLGRVASLMENPGGLGYLTNYAYDALDNLITVKQDSQTRSFIYDSLKRLTSATNPESGVINYEYDENGNLTKKTDARNVISTYVYDALNRVTNRSYSDSTPAVTLTYDAAGVPNSKGRLTAVTSSVSGYNYDSYDAMGRVLSGRQITDGQSYAMSYQYNLSGGMTSETYPSGKVVSTEYDTAARIAGVKKDATIYYAGGASGTADAMTYTPHGAVATMKLGNGRWEHTTFNSRMQADQIGVGTSSTDSTILRLDYGYGGASNNGNTLTQRTVIAGVGGMDVTQNYTYDSLNRLMTATESGTLDNAQYWSQTYDIDRYGNRAVRRGSFVPNSALTPLSGSASDLWPFDQAKNQLNSTASPNLLYDNVGNLSRDQVGSTLTYDAENHQTAFNGTNSQYFYDGDGHRVKKIEGGIITVFVHDVNGRLIAEYNSGPPSSASTSYLTSDPLGSTRLVTDGAGNVKARYDYLPFGEEIPSTIGPRGSGNRYGGADSTRQKFTGKERDSETGLDFFGARYFSSAQGRFTGVDPKLMPSDLANPQMWNKYSYALNNPLRYVDPEGATVLDAGVVKLGKASIREFKEVSVFDAGGLFFSSKAMVDNFTEKGGIRNDNPGWNEQEQDTAGGCIPFCDRGYSESPKGIFINVSFNYDKNDQLSGATITLPRDPSAAFLVAQNPGISRVTRSMMPNGITPAPEVMNVNIDSKALDRLSSKQLAVLAVEARKLSIPALGRALLAEIERAQGRQSRESKGTVVPTAPGAPQPDAPP